MNNEFIRKSDAVEILRARAEMANVGTPKLVFDAASRMIDKMPAVDALEVVRCRDCKWWTGEMMYYFPGYCLNINKCMGENGYCSSGCKKDEDNG